MTHIDPMLTLSQVKNSHF